MSGNYHTDVKKKDAEKLEKFYIEEKRKQGGVVFPSATKQEHLLIIRFDTDPNIYGESKERLVRDGLKSLCRLFDEIDNGSVKIDQLSDNGDIRPIKLSEFNFSATLGFGIGFFEKLKINSENRPRKLKRMPDNAILGDPRLYTLSQTDFIIQIGSNSQDLNRWVFQNSNERQKGIEKAKGMSMHGYISDPIVSPTECRQPEIYSRIANWSRITDIHTGFQRFDGRNLLGFNDGISNPNRLSNDVVWTTMADESDKFRDGTYMVFQKIEHDLEAWRSMTVEKQEEWIGRSKETGLLLGTLPKEEDRKLASDMHSDDPVVREQAKKKWKKLYNEQKNPETGFFDESKTNFKEIRLQCPVWSHVRKANPRGADGAPKATIFRRGYLYVDDGVVNGKSNSGLLFVCFQKDIEQGFEYITKNFLNNKDFPVPSIRNNFSPLELSIRHQHGRFTLHELEKGMARLYPNIYSDNKIYDDPDTQNTGRDGLSGPSELGIFPQGQLPITLPLGGGYYFIPPIPDRNILDISEQFFK